MATPATTNDPCLLDGAARPVDLAPRPLDVAPTLLDVASIARSWSVSENHVRRLIADGTLPGIRLGKLVRVAAEDVEAYVASRRGVGNVA